MKTDFTLTASGRRAFNVNFRNLPGGGWEWIDADPRNAGVSAATTYQLLENAFVHPFVSAGIRIGWVDTIRYTYSPRVYTPSADRTTVIETIAAFRLAKRHKMHVVYSSEPSAAAES